MQVMLPFYTSLPDDQLIGLDKVVDFPCPKGEVWDGEMRAGTLMTTIWRATIDGIPVLLVAPTDRNACNLSSRATASMGAATTSSRRTSSSAGAPAVPCVCVLWPLLAAPCVCVLWPLLLPVRLPSRARRLCRA